MREETTTLEKLLSPKGAIDCSTQLVTNHYRSANYKFNLYRGGISFSTR
jgi:hypothetical protein